MTYEVVFDVSERLPQLAVGVVASGALVVLILVGLVNTDALLKRWPILLGVGAAFAGLQFVLAHEWPFAIATAVGVGVIYALETAGLPDADPDWHEVPGWSRRVPRGGGAVMAGTFGLIFAVFVGLPMYAAVGLERQLLAGEATVLEGPVMVEARPKEECLVVDAQRYCYSNAIVQPGYNRTRTILGGPFDTGDQVRLSVIGDQIVRIEVAAPS